jgi:hypothetical protein
MSVLLETGMSAPARTSRAERFLDRVDAALPAMTPAEQRKFLDRLSEGWEQRYRIFVRSHGRTEYSADPRDPITAADFLNTIAGLAARRVAL